MSTLLEQAVALPIPERIKLVEDIWDSIVPEKEAILLTEAQEEELGRRLEYHRLHPNDTIPWKKVRDEALARQ